MKRLAFLCLLLVTLTQFRLSAQIDASVAMHIVPGDGNGSIVHGAIKGNLKDERGNPIVNAAVECSEGGVIRGREATDFDGNYAVGSLKPGKMTLSFKFQGKELVITDISLSSGQIRTVNGTLAMTMRDRPTIRCSCRIICQPIIAPKYPGGHASHSDTMLW